MRRYLLALLAFLPMAVVGQVRELPPHVYQPEKATVDTRFIGRLDAPATQFQLEPPTDAEKAALRAENKGAGKDRPLKIGFSRNLASAPLSVDALEWQATAGGRVARVKITSSGAAAVRVLLALQSGGEGLEFRFKGSARDQVFGPVSGAEIRNQGEYWSPVMEGETGLIEIYAPESAETTGISLGLNQLSHLLAAGADLMPARIKTVGDIGSSDSCEHDVACVSNPSQALLNASKAVAQMVFTSGGHTYLCTGTLLNSVYSDGTPTQVPYFYTAYHCINTQASASSLNTYWFFEAASCGSLATPAGYVVVGGGASLLYAVQGTDISFMRLNSAPPAGAYFGGWNAATVPASTSMVVLHHPRGDLKKFSQGSTQGYGQYDADHSASFIVVRYTNGSTEGGSSGSGLLTYNTNGYYQLRGGLLGGDALCSNMAGYDYYSPMDQGFSALSTYLTPSGTSTPTVVEFYEPSLDNFFITADPNEQQMVRSGAVGNWQATGYTFKASGTNQVCRFYGNENINPGTGAKYGPNSHFYTVDAAECSYLRSIFDPNAKSWKFESYDFMSTPPSAGSCPVGTVPVYRAYNRGNVRGVDSNHRITSSYAAYSQTVSSGWSPEGIVMCAPQ